ncbi:MAG: hypothetical protein AAFU85_27105, partial [Planctomycetota bacterium]
MVEPISMCDRERSQGGQVTLCDSNQSPAKRQETGLNTGDLTVLRARTGRMVEVSSKSGAEN